MSEPDNTPDPGNISPQGLYNLITVMESLYCPDVSRKVIAVLNKRMQNDEHVEPDLLYKLMKHVFARIMAGDSADQAFGLALRKGKYLREDTQDRDFQIAANVVALMRQGIRKSNAMMEIVEALALSERAVKRACRAHLESCEMLSDEHISLIIDTELPLA